MQTPSTLSRIVRRGFLVLGVPLIALALFFAARSAYLLQAGGRAHGTIVAILPSNLASSNAVPQAIVAFKPGNGAEVRFKDSSPSRAASFTVGQQVEVLYRPDRPSTAVVKQFRSLWLRSYQLGVLGLGVVVIALFLPSGAMSRGPRPWPQP